ncbi:MAG: hypothetical protein PVJ67_05770 [Candidatus Pacearchaeota archaeon]|jgi:hypothetical protein
MVRDIWCFAKHNLYKFQLDYFITTCECPYFSSLSEDVKKYSILCTMHALKKIDLKTLRIISGKEESDCNRYISEYFLEKKKGAFFQINQDQERKISEEIDCLWENFEKVCRDCSLNEGFSDINPPISLCSKLHDPLDF